MIEVVFCKISLMFSRKLFFLSNETNAHKEKFFCVVTVLFVLFAYFGIYALAFLKCLPKLYASQNHCCRNSQL